MWRALGDVECLALGRVLVLTGAGISAESGIPTYRGTGGVWATVDFEELATRRAFVADRERVWSWYSERRRGVQEARPNAAHAAVARLCARARDGLVVTQNVDDLHERAGLPADRLVHVHGKILESRCFDCDATFPPDPRDPVRPCPACAVGRLRPGVVWFGEALPDAEVRRVERFLDRGPCDLVLVVGTTASFPYVLSWIECAAAGGGLVIEINPDDSQLAARLGCPVLHVRRPAAEALPELVDRMGDRKGNAG